MTTPSPIKKLLCANRSEIAIRVFRAATELGIRTVAIYSHQDRVHLHRYKADEAYQVGRGRSPVGAYLDVEEIVTLARSVDADAIHPGYGFLSENPALSRACVKAGIAFVGPSPEVLGVFGDKTAARKLAQSLGIPTVPGSPGGITSLDEAQAFASEVGFPLIIKAAMGGGGRGMRVVRTLSELEESLNRARSEAEAAFGDGTVFLERLIETPRHIEVQVMADAAGNVMHFFERDCSVQRRHQKVVEMAPAPNLPEALRTQLLFDAVRLVEGAAYRNAGTVEFLVDAQGRHYFIEVNPRIQVEHTVTEEITGVDLVQTQILIAGGATFSELGLGQSTLTQRGMAIQCRVTTESPQNGFQPDFGRIEAYRSAGGMGVRLDGGSGYTGARITPDYDSLLVKVTAHALRFDMVVSKLQRALSEFRIRGVKTNIPFLQNVLRHPKFVAGTVDTTFVDSNPELFELPWRRNRAQRLLAYLGETVVNGAPVAGMSQRAPGCTAPPIPDFANVTQRAGWRDRLLAVGPSDFAKAVRAHEGLLVTDTTWRDAHQSLLATRVRTYDLTRVAEATNRLMPELLSLEMWGGATFDVALRFLHECPWQRLEQLRELAPNVPFQMLFRGANAVGYTSYPDNVVRVFARAAFARGIDIFRIFDSLNYLENLKLGIDAVGEAGGVIEAAICYTGDVGDPTRTKYSLQYYVDVAGALVELGTHLLCVKDMAGLLKPKAATLLLDALRDAYPDTPVHLHTHDTAGTGVATVLAAADAGVDAVDLAIPAMAGLTSQPTMAAVVGALADSPRQTGIAPAPIQALDVYWETVRQLYGPFETGLTGYAPDLYEHEIPGGQYTNLFFQARELGLADRWGAIKRAYAQANHLLGDLIKVTPSSKVVGDLAQFMVQNNLSEDAVRKQADTLSFPTSVVEFLEGRLGQPYGGFPEPLRTQVLRGREPINQRPGATLAPVDLSALEDALRDRFGPALRDVDALSAALYPKPFEDYRNFRATFSDLSVLPTRYFLAPLQIGEEISVDIERGKTLVIELIAVGDLDKEGFRRVFFELNGQARAVRIRDKQAVSDVLVHEQANPARPGSVGAPMPGTVSELRVKPGQAVGAGAPLIVLSAMKMETVVAAPIAGIVQRITIKQGDVVKGNDLLLELG